MKMLIHIIAAILIVCNGCGPKYPFITVKGKISDSSSHVVISNAHISEPEFTQPSATSDTAGIFILHEVSATAHTFIIEAEYYQKKSISFSSTGVASIVTLDVALKHIPDTAYTASGPVDASFFLSDTLLKRKKLSKNEAKRIVLKEITGGKILNAEMIREDHKLLWLFDVQHRKDFITVLIDAYTGKIINSEGNDKHRTRTENGNRHQQRDE